MEIAAETYYVTGLLTDMRRKTKREKNLARIADAIILTALIFEFIFPQISLAYYYNNAEDAQGIISEKAESVVLSQDEIKNEEIADELSQQEEVKVKYSKYVVVTAYSSTVDQCDSTPFITANGTRVHDGIIAANFLKFKTKIRFPDYSGDKIYTVEDRMHPRFSNRADIWMETRSQALQFGKRRIKIEVLE